MKITVTSLIYSLLFTVVCLSAKAQSLPDTLRIGIGVEGATTTGIFGTKTNTAVGGTAASAYSAGVGVSLRADFPIKEHLYVTANVGYNNFFTSSNSTNSQQAIITVPLPNFETIPLKLGVKIFIGNKFYFQGEAGETLLANKKALYAVYSNAFTYAPQFGLLMPLKKKHTYIDAGIRFESFQSFYKDNATNDFWAAHVTYTFNL
jgi:hypothetical protein